MASLSPGLGAGTADNVANQNAADISKTITDNEKVRTNLNNDGRKQAVTITGG